MRPRPADGTLSGCYNLCRHRGSPAGTRGAAPSRAADPGRTGRLRRARDPLPVPRLDLWRSTAGCGPRRSCPSLRRYRAELALHPVDVASWGGFVFARLDAGPETAEPLAASSAGPTERLAALSAGRAARRAARQRYQVAANWKVILENYNECYHCGPVHPELCELVPAFRARRRRPGLGRGHPAPPRGQHVHADRDHPPGARSPG